MKSLKPLFAVLISIASYAGQGTPPALLNHEGDVAPLPIPLPHKDREVIPIPTEDHPFNIFEAERPRLQSRLTAVSYEVPDKSTCQLTAAQKKVSHILLSAEHHDCKLCKAAIGKLIEENSKDLAGKTAVTSPRPPLLGYEGFYFGVDSSTQQPLREPSTGIFGIESPLHHSTAGILLALMELRNASTQPKIGGTAMRVADQLIDIFALDQEMAELFYNWFAKNQNVLKSNFSISIIAKFAQRAVENKSKGPFVSDSEFGKITAGKKRFVFDLIENKKGLQEIENGLSAFFAQKLIPFLRDNKAKFKVPDLQKLETYITKKDKELVWPLQLQFNLDWRNRAITESVIKLFCLAAKEGRDFHFTVGYLHVPGLTAMLETALGEIGGDGSQLILDPEFGTHSWHNHFQTNNPSDEILSEKQYLSCPYIDEQDPKVRSSDKEYAKNAACLMKQGKQH